MACPDNKFCGTTKFDDTGHAHNYEVDRFGNGRTIGTIGAVRNHAHEITRGSVQSSQGGHSSRGNRHSHRIKTIRSEQVDSNGLLDSIVPNIYFKNIILETKFSGGVNRNYGYSSRRTRNPHITGEIVPASMENIEDLEASITLAGTRRNILARHRNRLAMEQRRARGRVEAELEKGKKPESRPVRRLATKLAQAKRRVALANRAYAELSEEHGRLSAALVRAREVRPNMRRPDPQTRTTSRRSQMVATVDLMVKEVIKNNYVGSWAKNESLFSKLSVTVVRSLDRNTTRILSMIPNHQQFMSKLVELEDSINRTDVLLQDVLDKQLNSSTADHDGNTIKNYVFRWVDAGLPTEPTHLAYFAVVKMDLSDEELDLDPLYASSLIGRITSERVIDEGAVVSTGKIFRFALPPGGVI